MRAHGDGVHDLAWLVDDAGAAFAAAVARGAEPARAPWSETDDEGTLELAQIKTYGETCHTFVSRRRYHGRLLEPGYGTENLPPEPVGPAVGLTRIDHVVGNVEKGKLDELGALLPRGDRVPGSSCTSTTTRSPPSTRP